DQPHREERPALVLADLVDPHDAGVVEGGCQLRLGLEAADAVLGRKRPGADHLDGDDAVEPEVSGLVDDAHASTSQLAFDRVTGDAGSAAGGEERGGIERAGRSLQVGGGPVGGDLVSREYRASGFLTRLRAD